MSMMPPDDRHDPRPGAPPPAAPPADDPLARAAEKQAEETARRMRLEAEERRGKVQRTRILLFAVLLLAWAWHVDLVAMTMQDTLGTRLLRGILSAVVIILVAEFLWHALRATIDAQLQGAVVAGNSTDEKVRRRARLRTASTSRSRACAR